MISLPNFFFYTQDKPGIEKYTFKLGNGNDHFTLIYVAKKKVFDFHKKDETVIQTESDDPYYNFFEISSFKFFRFLQKLGMVQEYLAEEIILKNKINIGKLKKNNCWLIQLENINYSKDIYNIKRNGRELKSNKNLTLKELIDEIDLIHPDEIQNIDCNIFSVFKYKNGILYFQGFVYKFKNRKGLFFWSKKSVNYYLKCLMVATYNILCPISFKNKDRLLILLKDIMTSKYKYLK